MTPNPASCRCGQLTATGTPTRVSVCHCHDCEKCSGNAFAAQEPFSADALANLGDGATLDALVRLALRKAAN